MIFLKKSINRFLLLFGVSTVNNTNISIIEVNENDYISLTDMVKNIENGLALIEKWLRNKNTIEFLGIWEEMYNPVFITEKMSQYERLIKLNHIAIQQMKVLHEVKNKKVLK